MSKIQHILTKHKLTQHRTWCSSEHDTVQFECTKDWPASIGGKEEVGEGETVFILWTKALQVHWKLVSSFCHCRCRHNYTLVFLLSPTPEFSYSLLHSSDSSDTHTHTHTKTSISNWFWCITFLNLLESSSKNNSNNNNKNLGNRVAITQEEKGRFRNETKRKKNNC